MIPGYFCISCAPLERAESAGTRLPVTDRAASLRVPPPPRVFATSAKGISESLRRPSPRRARRLFSSLRAAPAFAFHCPLLSELCFVFATASHEEMAPRSSEKLPPTRALGYSHVTPEVLEGMILNGLVDRSQVQTPPADQASAWPEPDEVVVFRDFFTAGLRFPLDPMIMSIFLVSANKFNASSTS